MTRRDYGRVDVPQVDVLQLSVTGLLGPDGRTPLVHLPLWEFPSQEQHAADPTETGPAQLAGAPSSNGGMEAEDDVADAAGAGKGKKTRRKAKATAADRVDGSGGGNGGGGSGGGLAAAFASAAAAAMAAVGITTSPNKGKQGKKRRQADGEAVEGECAMVLLMWNAHAGIMWDVAVSPLVATCVCTALVCALICSLLPHTHAALLEAAGPEKVAKLTAARSPRAEKKIKAEKSGKKVEKTNKKKENSSSSKDKSSKVETGGKEKKRSKVPTAGVGSGSKKSAGAAAAVAGGPGAGVGGRPAAPRAVVHPQGVLCLYEFVHCINAAMLRYAMRLVWLYAPACTPRTYCVIYSTRIVRMFKYKHVVCLFCCLQRCGVHGAHLHYLTPHNQAPAHCPCLQVSGMSCLSAAVPGETAVCGVGNCTSVLLSVQCSKQCNVAPPTRYDFICLGTTSNPANSCMFIFICVMKPLIVAGPLCSTAGLTPAALTRAR
jgi:hypothetical protein